MFKNAMKNTLQSYKTSVFKNQKLCLMSAFNFPDPS